MRCNTSIFPSVLKVGSNYQLSADRCLLAHPTKPQVLDPVACKVVLSGRKPTAKREPSSESQYACHVNQTFGECSILEPGRIENYPN